MASDQKPISPSATQSLMLAEKGIRIFSYPKLIFMFPTLIASLICGIGMITIGDRPIEQKRAEAAFRAGQTGAALDAAATTAPAPHERFKTQENLLGVLFLGVFAFNLLMMALDFPRFSIVAIGFLVGFLVFFFLWLGSYFDLELMRYIHVLMAKTYAYANAQFYFLVAAVLAMLLSVIWLTRWLDYWQILPNEILHHHGPLSDMQQFKTMNLKIEKEIPDVFEFMFLGAGKLVLHIADEPKAVVLDNVLFINSVERSLKNLVSRMEVRVTSDQEVADL
jgi:hypothetical protein